jgi:threonyl-tRNA synthetase
MSLQNITTIETKRHSYAHVMAAAVTRIYPDTKLGIGPTVEHGFYYDMDSKHKFSIDDLPRIEEEMRKIIGEGVAFKKKIITSAAASALFKKLHQPFKLELVQDLKKENAELSVYETGDFTDLCRGPHIENSAELSPDSFKLTKIAGAYWKGDEKNEQLQRIYGLAFDTRAELEAHLRLLEEAERRDHRKLGKELGLFTISPLVGAGLPLMQPKGMTIRKEIEDYLWNLHKNKGYSRVWTPHIAKEDLYIISGHAAKFGDELFRVQGKEEKFIMKPMNCPHHMQIFADNQFSYRDMPIRYFEPATVYRDEKSGQLSGLTRVRSITQDDGHLFCRTSQIEQEVSTIVGIITEFYTAFGMMNGYWVSLSVRGDDKSKYLGSDKVWETAEEALETAAKNNKLNYRRVPGEATFYGPKLDFMFKDAIGREWQLATIQCDFNLPERFELSFVNEKGEKERPVVIHRAISGSLERFMGIMIEHYAGAFPLWLAPVQAIVTPVGENFIEYGNKVLAELTAAGIRAEIDSSNETLGKKIRNAEMQKIPYTLVVGEKEVSANTVAARNRETKAQEVLPLANFIAKIKTQITEKK